jgi:ATP-dependent Lon protease
VDVGTAQQVLETSDLKSRVEVVIEAVAKVREVMKLNNEIESSVKTEMSKSQREFLLRQQMKAIEKELGDKGEDEENELDELAKKLGATQPHASALGPPPATSAVVPCCFCAGARHTGPGSHPEPSRPVWP